MIGWIRFVSLKIAQETDQWILRNPKRRRRQRIHFDANEFEAYKSRVEGHYQAIEGGMAAAGTSALMLDYSEVDEPLLPFRLIDFFGLPAGPISEPELHRQNPGHLREKVSNYAEMCAALGMEPEAPVPEKLPGPDDFILARHAALALAPIPGPGFLPALVLMDRIDCRISGERPLGRADFLTGAAISRFPTGAANDRRAFAMISPPAERLEWLLLQSLSVWHQAQTRQRMQEVLTELPDVEGWTITDVGNRGLLLSTFLDLVEAALAGDEIIACPAAWHGQSELLSGLREDGTKITLYRSDEIEKIGGELSTAAGAAIPRGQLRSIRSVDYQMLGELPTSLTDRANRLHAGDQNLSQQV